MLSTCARCFHKFSSISSFDKHRTGTFEPPARRCLSPYEMSQAGMVQRAGGVWISEDKPWTPRTTTETAAD